ncbi:ADP-ribose pyrophosphatase [Mumia flava]|uniref:ADP-ribose pyrophosphatase n=1 Tax=Mumia flava TaxID=1348852 RepID=A0A2M9B603_9ACTN|nr:NUDIX hydrolase [Mumia flava]PJJ53368.1 ADP-ribose pyrophosphatase [Mumia flava]
MSRAPHPALPGEIADPTERLADRSESWEVASTERPYRSGFVDVEVDQVATPQGGTISRTTVRHHGAVGVVVLDDEGRVLMLEQYRHPVRARLLELPAGLTDVDGEQPVETAARELAEEADLVADSWEPLVVLRSSPGFTDEQVQVFLARGLSPVPPEERTARHDEEADMSAVWVPLEVAVTAVLERRVTNSLAVAGLLAAAVRLGSNLPADGSSPA